MSCHMWRIGLLTFGVVVASGCGSKNDASSTGSAAGGASSQAAGADPAPAVDDPTAQRQLCERFIEAVKTNDAAKARSCWIGTHHLERTIAVAPSPVSDAEKKEMHDRLLSLDKKVPAWVAICRRGLESRGGPVGDLTLVNHQFTSVRDESGYRLASSVKMTLRNPAGVELTISVDDAIGMAGRWNFADDLMSQIVVTTGGQESGFSMLDSATPEEKRIVE